MRPAYPAKDGRCGPRPPSTTRYDFVIGRRLTNLPALRQIGFSANRRLLDVQRLSHDPADGTTALTAVTDPVHTTTGQRVAGMRFTDPRVQALLSVLCMFRLLPRGFTDKDLRDEHLEPLLGRHRGNLTSGQATYDLRRLRHGRRRCWLRGVSRAGWVSSARPSRPERRTRPKQSSPGTRRAISRVNLKGGSMVAKGEPEEILDEAHEQLLQRVCAIDVAKDSGKVCLRVPAETGTGRRVSRVWDVPARTRAVIELADHLVCQGVEKVTVESTSDYWRIWFYLLEAAGLDVQLVNARDVKNVPGRPKTDKLDAVWLAKLTEKGLLRPSFVPPRRDPGAAGLHPAAGGPDRRTGAVLGTA